MLKHRVIVTSAFGLEALVKDELKALGFSGFTVADGKIEFDALLSDIPRLNISLRIADRVLLKVGEFEATDFGRLFDLTKELPWEDWIPCDAKLTVIAKCVRSTLMSARSCQSIVHKALVSRLMAHHKLEWLPETGPAFTVQVALLKDVAQLTLDTSGPGLHKRGYRVGHGDVPLRENLAAALVALSGWDGVTPLLDPMCGSGTILIEAAMMRRGIAPGATRGFDSERWPLFTPQMWEAARAQARAGVRPSAGVKLQGSDMDPAVIKDAQANAQKAGVAGDIEFTVKDIKALWVNQPRGMVISNPPYGIKLGSLKELTPLYVTIHHMFKNKKGWGIYILTADDRFPDFFKRARPDKVRKLYNGTIQVYYYQYFADRGEKSVGADLVSAQEGEAT